MMHLLDAARLLAGFALGYVTARTVQACPVCGQPTTTGLCARCAPVVHPRKENP